MSGPRPIASISLDLDNLWSYMMIHGDAGWERYPSYLSRVVPVFLDWAQSRDLTMTVFIVGKDAQRPENHGPLNALAEAGHELGNHSLSHEPWFHTFDEGRVQAEIGGAHAAIEAATGRRPVGYRGPGFSLTARTLRALSGLGYVYDASTFPTSLGPLARAYYFWSARGMSEEEKAKRSQLFGGLREGLRPITPYRWGGEGGGLVEIPVTTLPGLRLPIHMSYLGYLGGRAPALAKAYLRGALRACSLAGVSPSFLLHPLDFMGGDQIHELGFFPGMATPTTRKLALLDDMVSILSERFELVTMEAHARAALNADTLPTLTFA